MKNILLRLKNIPLLTYLVLLAMLSLITRLIFLTKASIWHDEGFTAMIMKLPPSEIISTTANDVHPPLYYLLLHFWQTSFGPSVISIRGFSVICGIITVIILYFLLKKLFSEKIARMGALFAAIGPFLVRYSNEARPYALAGLIAVISTYILVLAIQHRKKYMWALYGLTIALGVYIQYYLALLVPAHLIYFYLCLGSKDRHLLGLLRQPGLWISGATAFVLFLPWLPSFIAQATRVSSGFWIPPVDLMTIPNTISSFMAYSNVFTYLTGIVLTIIIIWLSIRVATKKNTPQPALILLLAWTFIPMIIVLLASLNRPVYIDRYFVFVAPAFYGLLSALLYSVKFKNRWVNPSLAIAIVISFSLGINTVGAVATHRMGDIGAVVNQGYKQGDKIISAELYTFFDFSYYNQTGSPVRLLSEDEFGQYGEWSLLHSKPHLRVTSLDSITPGRVWLVGKTGEHDYYDREIPEEWTLLEIHQAVDSAVRLYYIHQQ